MSKIVVAGSCSEHALNAKKWVHIRGPSFDLVSFCFFAKMTLMTLTASERSFGIRSRKSKSWILGTVSRGIGSGSGAFQSRRGDRLHHSKNADKSSNAERSARAVSSFKSILLKIEVTLGGEMENHSLRVMHDMWRKKRWNQGRNRWFPTRLQKAMWTTLGGVLEAHHGSREHPQRVDEKYQIQLKIVEAKE